MIPYSFSCDIETGPQSRDEVLRVVGPFNPAKVKVGNLTDPAKIAAKIEAERASYADKTFEEAPLSPLTGQVEAIGYADDSGAFEIVAGPERDILADYWTRWSRAYRSGGAVYGWNFNGFDGPFIWTRSMILGVCVPDGARRRSANGWASYPAVIDLMIEYTGAPNEFARLELVARAFGHSGKNGEAALFWSQFREPATREQAVAYLRNDLEMTHLVRRGLGCLTATVAAAGAA